MGSIFKNLSLFGNNYVKWKVIQTVRSPSSSSLKYYIPYFQYRLLTGTVKHHGEKHKPLSSTSIIVEDGLSVLEMPCIVQVINGDFEVTNNGKTDNGDSYVGLGLECHRVPKTLFKKIDFQEEFEMALRFMRCNSLKEVFSFLNICPEKEITPCVALAAIRRIFDLENNFKFRNEGPKGQYPKKSNNTFTRSALIKRLIETICESTEPQVIVDALRSMGRDTNKRNKWKYLEPVCTESIILATDGKLNVSQVCEVIKAFHNLGNVGKNFVDKVWVGINDKNEISEDDLCEIMSILPLVQNSRTYLCNIVERKIPLVWHKLKPEHIIRIVYILVHLKVSSNRLLSLISRWTALSIHRLTEGNVKWIVHAFLSLEYTDENIQKALSHYMTAKKTSIKDYSLVSVILDYCKKLHIRHPTILDFGAEYYIEHGQNMPASQVSVIMNCFGYLKYTPQEQAFFQVLESHVDEKFSQFTPKELLDILHSCIYLQRYPLNFVKKVFNPHFFHRLYSSDDKDTVSNREKLLILDTVLTLETLNYNGPILPRNYSTKAIRRDARTLRCINRITPSLVEIVGSEDKIYHSVVIPALPPVSLFVIDCIVDVTGKISFSNFKLKREKFALLILLPEYYDITENILLGPQTMKKRIIEYFGFKVVGINYRILNRLLVYPDKLKEYLQQEMEKASEL